MAIPTPTLPASTVTSFDVRMPESGARVRRRRYYHRARRFRLVYPPGRLTATEANDILTEWNNADGSTRTFSWTPWDEASAIDVRFASDEIPIDVKNAHAYGCTFDLVEEIF